MWLFDVIMEDKQPIKLFLIIRKLNLIGVRKKGYMIAVAPLGWASF